MLRIKHSKKHNILTLGEDGDKFFVEYNADVSMLLETLTVWAQFKTPTGAQAYQAINHPSGMTVEYYHTLVCKKHPSFAEVISLELLESFNNMGEVLFLEIEKSNLR